MHQRVYAETITASISILGRQNMGQDIRILSSTEHLNYQELTRLYKIITSIFAKVRHFVADS